MSKSRSDSRRVVAPGTGGTRGDAPQQQQIEIPVEVPVEAPVETPVETPAAPVTQKPEPSEPTRAPSRPEPVTQAPKTFPKPPAPPAQDQDREDPLDDPDRQLERELFYSLAEQEQHRLDEPEPVSAPPAPPQATRPELNVPDVTKTVAQQQEQKVEQTLLDLGGLEVSTPKPEAPLPPQEMKTQGADVVESINDPDVTPPVNRAADMEPMVPVKPATPAKLPDKTSRAVDSEQRKEATSSYGTDDKGSAVRGQLTAGWSVALHEVAVSADQLVSAWRHQTSGLRELMNDAGYDEAQMVASPVYATWAVTDFFTNNAVEALAQKAPLVDEASVHRRVVRINPTRGIKINPLVFAMWNADFDGDDMILSFDPEAKRGAKSAMDFLIGTEGEGKIDPAFFDPAPWGDGTTTVYAHLQELFMGDPDTMLELSEAELKGLAAAIEMGWDPKTRGRGFRLLMKWARQIGEAYPEGPKRDQIVARVLTDIYNQNKDIRLITLGFTASMGYIAPANRNGKFTDESAYAYLESVSETPSNMKDLETALGTPIGFVKDKNIHFRVGAGILKAARQVTHFMGFRQPGNAFEDKVALMASGVEEFDERARGVSDWARRIILESVGFPADGHLATGDFEPWLERFARRWNYVAYTVNSVTANFNLDDTVSPADRKTYVDIIPMDGTKIERNKKLRSVFKDVFGGYTMGRVFGSACPAGYEDVTIDEFVHTNKANPETEAGAKFLGDNTTPFDTPIRFIGRLADLRTSFAAGYDKAMDGALQSQFKDGRLLLRKVIKQRSDMQAEGGRYEVFDADLVVLTDAMRAFGTDIFYFLGLNTPADFERSELGRKFLQAKNADQLGGFLIEAVTRYRFEPIQHAEKMLDAAKNGRERRHWQTELDHELDELYSSSETWAAIVRDYRDGGDVLPRILLANKTKTAKADLIVELVRSQVPGRKGYTAVEFAAGIMANPKGLYARDRFISDFGHTNMMKNVRAASDKITAYAKSNWETITKDIADARSSARPGQMKRFLAQVAKDPWILTPIEDWQIADAVLSTMEKSYPSSEKAQQEAEVSYIYSAISNLINAGTWSDLVVGTDFALGSISLDRLAQSPGILARALSDPDFAIRVYDGTGSTILSQRALFGKVDPTDDQIWDWMQENPRVAMALRLTTMENSVNKESGFSYANATKSLQWTMRDIDKGVRPVDRCLKELADHPGFYAMVALMTPMTGMRRAQLRERTQHQVWRAIDLIRGFSISDMSAKEFVRGMVEKSGLPDGITLEEVDRLYKEGQAQEGVPLADADQFDVRDTREYQIGQVMARLADDLETYSTLITTGPNGLPWQGSVPLPRDLFRFDDEASLRAYFDTIQVMSAAKTEVSTSVNAAESKKNAALMFLAQWIPKACGAPDPIPVSFSKFEKDWESYLTQQVRFPGLEEGDPPWWVGVHEANVAAIVEQAKEMGLTELLIEDPKACLDKIAKCERHINSDPSTNFSGRQSAALARMLTVIRTLSGEGLNLKVKTLGDDGSDSIVKNRVFDILDVGLEQRLKDLWEEMAPPAGQTFEGSANLLMNDLDAINAVRTALAEHLQQTYKNMTYGDELSLADWEAIAHLLVRRVRDVDGIPTIKLLSIGQLNAICAKAASDYVNEQGDKITHQGVIDKMLEALSNEEVVTATLDMATIAASVDVAPKRAMFPKLHYQRMSSFGRNLALAKEIVKSNPDLTVFTDEQMDRWERTLFNEYANETNWKGEPKWGEPWDDVVGVMPDHRDGGKRFKLRVVGVFTPEGVKAKEMIGPRNAWLMKRGAMNADAIVRAYELGITVLIEGTIRADEIDWKDVSRRTGGAIDFNQLVRKGTNSFILPMFDIRLNGVNRAEKQGAFSAGVIHALPEQIYFYFESIVNKHSAADAEFIPTRWFSENIKFKRTGEYRIPVRAAFANLMWQHKRDGGQGAPRVTIATRKQIEEYFVDGYVSETAADAPPELDVTIPVDLGKARSEEGSREEKRFREDVKAYLARYHETNENGMLPSGKPDEIVGWMRAEYDGDVRYHPIRMFELGHGSGAPTDMEIGTPQFDTERQEMVLPWTSSGNMLGRMFKLFEGGYAANKYMARADSVEDMELANGVKVAGYVAKQSTAGRRLLMRRQQKMMTLMYMARLSPYGYNFAEKEGHLPNNEGLREMLLVGDPKLDIGAWDKLLKRGDIQFYPEEGGMRNAFLNDMVRKAIRYKINPSVVLASRYGGPGGTPSNLWFNFQVLFGRGPVFQQNLQTFLNDMMPTLVPASIEDEGTDTLFNSNLQVYMEHKHTLTTGKRKGETIKVGEWVDLFGGFHFLDEHYAGHSNAGSSVKTDGIPGLNTLMAGGKELNAKQLKAYFGWGNLGQIGSWSSTPNKMTSPDREIAE